MNISVASVFRAYETNLPRSNAPSSGRSSRADEKKDMTVISSHAKDFQTAKREINGISDIRVEKVNEIKQRLNANLYNVNVQLLAEKIISGVGSV